MSERLSLLARAKATPNAPALLLPNRTLTWAALAAEALALEASFARQGVEPGDIVATRLPSTEFATVVHGLWLRGATVLPLNARLTTAEAAFQLKDASARWLIADEATPGGRGAALLGEVAGLRALTHYDPRDLGTAGRETRPFSPERILAVLYTSGTTGKPKGALLTAANFQASALASRQHLDSQASDRCLACLPLFHVGGLSILVRSLLLGSSVQVHDGFDPAAVSRALERDGITDVSFVANMLARVVALRGDAPAPPSLRTVLLGGGPAPAPLLRAARDLGYPIAPTYGLTEATSQVATRAPQDIEASGLRPLPGVQVRIEALDGHGGTGGDEEGEVLVRGATIVSGYLNRPEESARALRGGWLHTGDIGRLHADGTLTILDRRSDLIVSGGENIYPAEIEAVLAAHPEIEEVGVGTRSDERFGRRPAAWYVSSDGAALDEEALDRFCRERLAAFKVPVAFCSVPELPRTATGKVLRSKLRFPPEPPPPTPPTRST